jgi:hypothetical protein
MERKKEREEEKCKDLKKHATFGVRGRCLHPSTIPIHY